MPKTIGSQANYVRRLRCYEHFSDIPLFTAAKILDRLGLRGGWMRKRALQFNPQTVVAYLQTSTILDRPDDGELIQVPYWLPIGWLTVTKKGAWGNRRPQVQVFVEPRYRQAGLGTKLVQRAITRWKLDGKAVQVSPDDAGIEKFFTKAGLE